MSIYIERGQFFMYLHFKKFNKISFGYIYKSSFLFELGKLKKLRLYRRRTI